MYLSERGVDRRVAWLATVPAGLVAYLGFTAVRGYGFLAPFAGESSDQFHHYMAGPLQTFVSAVQSAAAGARFLLTQPIYQPSIGGPFSDGAESIVLLAVLGIAIVALVLAIRRLPIAYGAYALAVLLICTWSPVDGQPLKSFDRYALTIFPLGMAAGAWLSERRLAGRSCWWSPACWLSSTSRFTTWHRWRERRPHARGHQRVRRASLARRADRGQVPRGDWAG